ncbi:MAG: flagellar type III secretion system pore protein FliP [Thiobacillus sp.]
MRALFVGVLLLILGLGNIACAAEASVPLFTAAPGASGQTYGVSAASLPYLILFPFLPALLLAFSAFTRIAVVLFLLRQGLGSPSVPPNLVLIGLALLLTYFVMSPALENIQVQAYAPFTAGQITLDEARNRAAEPLKTFMLRQTRAEDLALFTADIKIANPKDAATIPFKSLAPAFLTSELKTAFQIGFMVVLPFLVIDLVVASVLTALGMVMLPPQLVSLPLKLLLFVVANGWHLLVGSLIGSF